LKKQGLREDAVPKLAVQLYRGLSEPIHNSYDGLSEVVIPGNVLTGDQVKLMMAICEAYPIDVGHVRVERAVEKEREETGKEREKTEKKRESHTAERTKSHSSGKKEGYGRDSLACSSERSEDNKDRELQESSDDGGSSRKKSRVEESSKTWRSDYQRRERDSDRSTSGGKSTKSGSSKLDRHKKRESY